MKTFKQYLSEELSASEALYGFMGWLTSRKKTSTFGAKHEAGTAAEMIGKFMDQYRLKKPREGWDRTIKPIGEFVEPPEQVKQLDVMYGGKSNKKKPKYVTTDTKPEKM